MVENQKVLKPGFINYVKKFLDFDYFAVYSEIDSDWIREINNGYIESTGNNGFEKMSGQEALEIKTLEFRESKDKAAEMKSRITELF